MTVNDYMGSLDLPDCAPTINGVYLEESILGYRTGMVTGRGANSISISEQTLGTSGDTKYVSKRVTSKDLVIYYNLVADTKLEYLDKHAYLVSLLQTEDSKFIFRDETDKYYIGTVSGITENILDGGGIGVYAANGTITIRCSDPYKYSTAVKTFETYVDDDGYLSMDVINSGAKDVPIDFNITMHQDNGYVGIVSDAGAIQIGKIEEVDGEDYQQNEAVNVFDLAVAAPDDHTTAYIHEDHVNGGSISKITYKDRDGLYLTDYGDDPVSNKWNGGLKTITIPADSEGNFGSSNFYCYTNHYFEIGRLAQTGDQAITFLTDNNEMICAMNIYKSNTASTNAYTEFWVNGKIIKSIKFTPSSFNSQNPFNFGRGHNDFRKEGDTITFYWWGSHFTYVDSTITNMKCTKIQVSSSNYSTRGLDSYNFITRNYIRSISYQIMHVDKWKDVPNRYSDGDLLFVDGNAGRIYLNGMLKVSEEVKGSKYFLAAPGTTKVKFTSSSFCTTVPTIIGSIREGWL